MISSKDYLKQRSMRFCIGPEVDLTHSFILRMEKYLYTNVTMMMSNFRSLQIAMPILSGLVLLFQVIETCCGWMMKTKIIQMGLFKNKDSEYANEYYVRNYLFNSNDHSYRSINNIFGSFKPVVIYRIGK